MRTPGQPGVDRREFLAWTAAAMVGSLGGCLGSPTEPADGPSRITARPHLPYRDPVLGFSPLGLRNEFTERDGLLYVPPTYHSASPAPLLILLHGSGGTGNVWNSPQVAALADSVGTVILAPDSRSLGTWDIVESGNYDTDVPFLNQALNHTFDQCRIDPTRVAIGGFSDGASTALSLGVANGDFTRSVIGFSPGFVDDQYTRGTPRVFVSHGDMDPVLSFPATRDIIVPYLQSLGLSVTWVPFEGVHSIPSAVATAAFQWLGANWGVTG